MSEPIVVSMAEVRSHLADVIDRARREATPTITTRRGKQEAVVIDIEEYQRLRRIAEGAEEAWLNRLADEAESEGTQGSVPLEEMDALLRADQGRPVGVGTRFTPHAQRDTLKVPRPDALRILYRLAELQESHRRGRHHGVRHQSPPEPQRPMAAQGR